jgi:hypothetical protein
MNVLRHYVRGRAETSRRPPSYKECSGRQGPRARARERARHQQQASPQQVARPGGVREVPLLHRRGARGAQAAGIHGRWSRQRFRASSRRQPSPSRWSVRSRPAPARGRQARARRPSGSAADASRARCFRGSGHRAARRPAPRGDRSAPGSATRPRRPPTDARHAARGAFGSEPRRPARGARGPLDADAVEPGRTGAEPGRAEPDPFRPVRRAAARRPSGSVRAPAGRCGPARRRWRHGHRSAAPAGPQAGSAHAARGQQPLRRRVRRPAAYGRTASRPAPAGRCLAGWPGTGGTGRRLSSGRSPSRWAAPRSGRSAPAVARQHAAPSEPGHDARSSGLGPSRPRWRGRSRRPRRRSSRRSRRSSRRSGRSSRWRRLPSRWRRPRRRWRRCPGGRRRFPRRSRWRRSSRRWRRRWPRPRWCGRRVRPSRRACS